MRLPALIGRRVERRQQQPFTDAVVSAVHAQAAGPSPDSQAIAALEVAAGLYARCFAAATVEAPGYAARALNGRTLALVARNLIRRGEDVHRLDVDDGEVVLTPAGSWDVRGGWRESDWWYRLDLFGPSGNVTELLPAASVVHARYSTDPSRPWLGIPPLGWARATGTLAAGLEQRLGEEAGGPVGHVIAVPQGPDDPASETDPLDNLRVDLANARGATVLSETTAAGWDAGKAGAPQRDYVPARFGADPPAALPELRRDSFAAVLAACGVPPDLAVVSTAQGQREAFRRFLTTGLEPLGELVADELAAKLDGPVAFDFSGTYAHDLAGRAAAFAKLVQGGMDVEQAVAVSGLAAGEE